MFLDLCVACFAALGGDPRVVQRALDHQLGRLLTLRRGSSPSRHPNAPLDNATTRVESKPQNWSRRSSSSSSSDGRMEPSPKEHPLKRHTLPLPLSFPGKPGKGKEKEKDAKKTTQSPVLRPQKPTNKLELIFESPPNVFYGNPDQSSGALLSGLLRMTIVEPEVTLSSFTMSLLACVTTKKPVVRDCQDCMKKSTELHRWTFIIEPKRLLAGEHSFPFSYLIPGNLPASTVGQLATLEYYLDAKATPLSNGVLNGASDAAITMRRPLHISRAVAPLNDKNSLRIFPPTKLTAHITAPPVIHPIGDFDVQMRLTGCTEIEKDTQKRWRLRKMSWKIEETEKMTSPPCAKHFHKASSEGKGIQCEDTRATGQADLKSGWKSDLSEGSVELEFTCRPSSDPRPSCDVTSTTGMKVSHSLVIELVIAEEWAPNKRPDQSAPTGAARVLRMQLPLMVTERAGMGISWDEEQPPMYEDVPASPPMYPQMLDRAATGATPFAPPREPSEHRSEIVEYVGSPLGTPQPTDQEITGFFLDQPIASSPSAAGPSSSAMTTGEGSNWGTSSSDRGRRTFNSADLDFDGT